MTRLLNNIALIGFSAIIAFTFILSCYGLLNTVSKLDYRVNQGKQEIADANR
jgi:hypothetical protein